MQKGDILVFFDRSRAVVLSAETSLFDSDLFSGSAVLSGREVSFSGVFIRGRGRVWVQN